MKKSPKVQKYRGGAHLKKDKADVVFKTRRGRKIARTLRAAKVMSKLSGLFTPDAIAQDAASLATQAGDTDLTTLIESLADSRAGTSA